MMAEDMKTKIHKILDNLPPDQSLEAGMDTTFETMPEYLTVFSKNTHCWREGSWGQTKSSLNH